MKKRDALPYCVSKELWLEKKFWFLHSRKEERKGKETPLSREDRRLLAGSLS